MPSIVVGIFAYVVVVLPFRRFSALAGGFALAVMMIPIVVRTTEELLALVPPSLREGALALGATRGRAAWTVILPAALPGIVTGVLVALARVAGETAPLLFTSLNNRYWSTKLTEPIASLTVQIYTYALGPYEDWHRQAWAGVHGAHRGRAHLLDPGPDRDPPSGEDAPTLSLREVSMTSETAGVEPGIRIRTEVRASTAPVATLPSRSRSGTSGSLTATTRWSTTSAMDIPERQVTALIGPSGCGKSTLLRCLNRMNDLIDSARVTGTIRVKGRDIYAPGTDVIDVRRRVGMVFQKSNPFPKSIYENVVYGLRIAGIRDRRGSTRPASAACGGPLSGTR